ncbi:Zinc finger BED domain-containing protein 4 [Merluccius polli]|uniref:Zinc finger BED domain-containing protein 4 n=1 Tax=Merluccius polli TaxID=89951 RepID=A0AA47M646_MERPO|nr:Zinc finger BED domain-containing protein 4 [Merluccius polli]
MEAISFFICKDIQPYSVTGNEGFKHLLEVLEPRYSIPDRKVFTDRKIPGLYDKRVAITVDGWTSCATDSYITITAHYVDDEWDLQSHILQTRVFNQSYTGVNLVALLQDVLREWNIADKNPALVTDNARNIIVAGAGAELDPHVRCVAHTLHLASQKALKLDRVWKVVTYFHKSPQATEILRDIQSQLHLPNHKLIHDVSIRWNSSLDMLERFWEQQPALLNAMLSRRIKSGEGLAAAMKKTPPTLSMIAPIQAKLHKHFSEDDSDLPVIADMKQRFRQDCSGRYLQLQDLLHSALALDPRFKDLTFLDDVDTRDLIFMKITTEVGKMNEKKTALDQLFGEFLTTRAPMKTIREKAKDEILKYRERDSLDLGGDVLQWWKKQVEIGIITGCTISVTLFSLAMNMLTKSAEPECRGPRTNSGQRQPPIRAFMDDLTVMTESVPGCRWILKGLEKLVEWARMRFKPIKSRSMVVRKGKVEDKFRFHISGTAIPTITEKPVKSLGKVFDCSLRDTTSIQSTCTELDGWLKSVDKSGLPGKFKAWVYQHGILPRILWPLLVYAVPISTVETLERRVSNHLRRWLGLPRSLSSIALYGNTNKLQLPFKSLEEEFKVTRAREVVQYRDASDPKVAKAGIQVRTGRKWRAEEAVQEADARLRQRCLVGVVTRGRAGLGSFPSPQMNTRGKERRRLVQEEVRAAVEETRTCKAVGMKQQWENAVERKVTWAELWKAEPHRIKFLIQAVYDVLPSPSNLHTWGIAETPACPLCSKRGTLEHILSCCTRALGDGRYRWRHDQVLKTIAEAISTGLEWAKHVRPSKKSIAFVRAGDKPTPVRRTSSAGILMSARDWQVLVDLEHQLKFPSHIVVTTLRPDIVLVSESTKQAVLLELTVPWEDRLEEAFERKLSKYAGLVSDCHQAGWRARCFPVEVGCRGFAARSLARAFSTLGIEGERKRRAIRSTTDAAERASRWLWLKRGEPWSHALAKNYLSIPATSVSSEHVFSTAGDIVPAQRSLLHPDHVDQLIFLKKNLKKKHLG